MVESGRVFQSWEKISPLNRLLFPSLVLGELVDDKTFAEGHRWIVRPVPHLRIFPTRCLEARKKKEDKKEKKEEEGGGEETGSKEGEENKCSISSISKKEKEREKV